MSDIRTLCRHNKEELLESLVDLAKEAFDEGVYNTEPDEEYFNEKLDDIENIIYVLKNCNYRSDDEE